MSHHYSGPNNGFPLADARLDLTDFYAFPKPGDAGKSVLIMNVHPSAAIAENPPGPTTPSSLSRPEAYAEIKIDTDGDAVADIAYRVCFSSTGDGTQTASLRRVEGAQAAGTDDTGQTIIEKAPVSTDGEAQITEAGDYRFFAGWRSDPFFFDVRGALNDMQFTGDDFFADKDVCGIVLELPNTALGGNMVGLWARTLYRANGGWVQADRGARPAQAVFLVGEERNAYLAGEPAHDARFSTSAAPRWSTQRICAEEAKRVATNSCRTSYPLVTFPDNGRSTHRRCPRRLSCAPHQWKSERRRNRTAHGFDCRIPLPGAAAQRRRQKATMKSEPRKRLPRCQGTVC